MMSDKTSIKNNTRKRKIIVNHTPTNCKLCNKNPEPRDEASQGSQTKKQEKKMIEEKQFKPCAMYKWQLAQQYHPTLDRDSAVTALRRWIARNDELMRELRATGYNHRCKEFTALQVQLIVEYLGEP